MTTQRPSILSAELYAPTFLRSRTASAVDEIVSKPRSSDEGTAPQSEPIQKGDAESGYCIRGPGTVEVRLLTMTPRLWKGLRDELPPNRARRATELVAYLALHHPDVVTSDRLLSTRVLGSSDADAASKTLFNTASAARRAPGHGCRWGTAPSAGKSNGPLPNLGSRDHRCSASGGPGEIRRISEGSG